MTMPQRALSSFVVVLLLGTIWAYQQESAWVDVFAPACIAAGLVQLGLILRQLRARRD